MDHVPLLSDRHKRCCHLSLSVKYFVLKIPVHPKSPLLIEKDKAQIFPHCLLTYNAGKVIWVRISRLGIIVLKKCGNNLEGLVQNCLVQLRGGHNKMRVYFLISGMLRNFTHWIKNEQYTRIAEEYHVPTLTTFDVKLEESMTWKRGLMCILLCRKSIMWPLIWLHVWTLCSIHSPHAQLTTV